MKTKRIIQKFGGYLSVAILLIVSVTPNTFHIPVAMQPWLFMVNIAWIVVLASGVIVP